MAKKNDLSAKHILTENKNAVRIQPISSRTRAAAKVQSKPPGSKKGAKINCALLLPPSNSDGNSKSYAVESYVTATAKSKGSSEVAAKTSRRISNEFEKTEESLYVSALEEIPADLSRLSEANLAAKSDVESSASSLSSQSSDLASAAQSTPDGHALPDRQLPNGVEDFDKENWNDPFQVSNYAVDIFEYLKHRETDYKIKGKNCNQDTA